MLTELKTRSGTILKTYVAIVLVIAIVFSPLAFSFIPVLLLAWYLFEWRRPLSPMIDLLTQYFVFFATALIYSSFIPSLLAPLISLPVLLLISQSLEKVALTANFQEIHRKRNLTGTAASSLFLFLLVLVIALIVTNVTLIISSGLLILGFIALGTFIYRRFPLKPVEEIPVPQRILAGKEEHVQIKLNVLTKLGSLLRVKSDYDWVKLHDNTFSIKGDANFLNLSLTPTLSGPSSIQLTAYAADRWGLMQTQFNIEPVKLNVIPRARYAAWLAQKYMAGTKPGALPLISNLGSIKATQGFRQGIEYYGNRLYQPGDSMKTIDWKHSSKFNELITKEFTEFRGQQAIILINLCAGDTEEADKLAYNIIVTAISLGQENIPGAIAAYNHEKVVLTTATLYPSQLVMHSLQLLKEIRIIDSPLKYFNPPDISRLRTNISRISQAESGPAKVLAELLRLEYQNYSENAKVNPCTQALSEVKLKVSAQSNVVAVSERNHDAEALAFNSFTLSQKGISVINV